MKLIENFNCVKFQNTILKPLTIIKGENFTGKTKFLEDLTINQDNMVGQLGSRMNKEIYAKFMSRAREVYPLFDETEVDMGCPPNNILLACLLAQAGDMFVVENPEAYLSSYSQNRICEVFTEMASMGVQVILETLSEDMIFGVKLAIGKGIISYKNVIINEFSKIKGDKEPIIKELTLDKNGNFVNSSKFSFKEFEEILYTI